MILVDSSVWVEYDRATGSASDLRLRGLIETGGPVAVTEPVIMEVLASARDERRETDLSRLLLRFELLGDESVAAPDLPLVVDYSKYWAVCGSGDMGRGACSEHPGRDPYLTIERGVYDREAPPAGYELTGDPIAEYGYPLLTVDMSADAPTLTVAFKLTTGKSPKGGKVTVNLATRRIL